MPSSCLTYPVVSLSYSVRLYAVPSSFRRLPRCLLARLVSSRLSFRLSARRAGRLGNGRRLCLRLRLLWPCDGRSTACSSVRSASRPPIAPPLDTADGEGSGAIAMLASFGFLPSAALVSVMVGRVWSACLFLRHRSFPFCGVRCADFMDRVHCGCRGCFPMVYCSRVVRGG